VKPMFVISVILCRWVVFSEKGCSTVVQDESYQNVDLLSRKNVPPRKGLASSDPASRHRIADLTEIISVCLGQ